MWQTYVYGWLLMLDRLISDYDGVSWEAQSMLSFGAEWNDSGETSMY
jgi:hypothetical protein